MVEYHDAELFELLDDLSKYINNYLTEDGAELDCFEQDIQEWLIQTFHQYGKKRMSLSVTLQRSKNYFYYSIIIVNFDLFLMIAIRNWLRNTYFLGTIQK